MNKWIAIIVVMQGLVLLGQWTGGTVLSTANAQIPDAGAIRLAQLEEQRKINAKLDQLISLMESGKLQVVVSQGEKK